MNRKKDLIAAMIVFVAAFVIFWRSPIHHVSDSRYAMLFSEQLLWRHSFSSGPATFPQIQSKPGQRLERGKDFPYQLIQVGDRFYYWYPPGTAILSMPFVAAANAFGFWATRRNGMHNPHGEQEMESVLASLLMAGFSVVVFFTSRLLLSFWWSLLIVAATAFGTQVWSIASRTMWTHTWGILILGIVILFIFSTEIKQVRLRPVLLATCSSWLYFVRPTFGSSIVALAIYIFIFHRKHFVAFAVTGCAWLAAFVAFSKYHFGTVLPDYYQQTSFSSGMFREAFAANLVSPARGLLIYVPVLLFVGYLLVRYRDSRRLGFEAMAIAVISFHIVLISGFVPWHAGHSYGPRLSTDLVPWFVLLGIIAVDARLNWRSNNRSHDSAWRISTEGSFALVLLAWGMILNGIGANSINAWRWNTQPNDIYNNVDRLWDWKHPQFLGVPGESRSPAKIEMPNGSARFK